MEVGVGVDLALSCLEGSGWGTVLKKATGTLNDNSQELRLLVEQSRERKGENQATSDIFGTYGMENRIKPAGDFWNGHIDPFQNPEIVGGSMISRSRGEEKHRKRVRSPRAGSGSW